NCFIDCLPTFITFPPSIADCRPPRRAPRRPRRAAPREAAPGAAPGRAPCAPPCASPSGTARGRDAVVAPPRGAVPDAPPGVAPPRRSPRGAPGLTGRGCGPRVALVPDRVAPPFAVEDRPARRVLPQVSVDRGVGIDGIGDCGGRGPV